MKAQGTTREAARRRAVERCRERGVLIPTVAEMRDPDRIDPAVRSRLSVVDRNAVDPINLFRITWRNDPETGGFGEVDAIEFPPVLTGVDARIIGLVGKHFPTGAHKVGAAFGCLVPRLVTGEFDPTTQRVVWPSTGNFCRGGAFDSALLGCRSVAILPEEMSPERFEWLRGIGAEIIATPGCESNVKEIYDKCHEIRRTDPDAVIFNQFEEFGNYLWHYGVTGPAAESVYERLAGAAGGVRGRAARAGGRVGPGDRAEETGRRVAGSRDRLSAWVATSGSSGTLGAGDYLKQRHPDCRIIVGEALQCPTLLMNGFGGHRIEGIGDKHVPWIHNVRNTDMVVAIDDAKPLALLRLFNEPAGLETLARGGMPDDLVERLPLLGLSSIANLIASIKVARYYELGRRDVVLTSLTDSAELYESRLGELTRATGAYDDRRAIVHWERHLLGTTVDHVKELTFADRKAIHNLKYFTWVEQQGRALDELNALWSAEFWADMQAQLPEWDPAIEAFNRETGVLERLRK